MLSAGESPVLLDKLPCCQAQRQSVATFRLMRVLHSRFDQPQQSGMTEPYTA